MRRRTGPRSGPSASSRPGPAPGHGGRTAGIVPDADFDVIGADENYRDTPELDSLDFLALVERLSARTGCRIDEDDHPRLATLDGTADVLVERT